MSLPKVDWDCDVAVCVASGPSLSTEQLAYVHRMAAFGRCKVGVTNSTWEKARWAHVLYAADLWWWIHNRPAAFNGIKICGEEIEGSAPPLPDIHFVKVDTMAEGLSLVPGLLHGMNSGYQLINVFTQLGSKRIILLGYDMRLGPGGRSHHHPDHVGKGMRNAGEKEFAAWLPQFKTLAAHAKRIGIEIVNCTPGSALDAFGFSRLEMVLC